MQGMLLTLRGKVKEGIPWLEQAEEEMAASTSRISLPAVRGNLADAYWKIGETKRGLSVVKRALRDMQSEQFYRAELHRLNGELLLQQSAEFANAERCFQEAIDVAARQKALFLLLRAAMSLARLRKLQGREDEGLRQIADIYERFREGFDAHDLQQASAMLKRE